jgi:peptidoglycan/xylan/chitin deacetylase (PgdA/CDA1 family)
VNGRALRWLASLVPRPDGAGVASLVVIRHHRVYGPDERPLYRLGVGEDVLRAQLALLAGRGQVPVTVSEGLARLASGEPRRTVALSFDDGYADNARRALPLLAATGARATFFLPAGLVEERRAPWWDEVAHLLAGARGARLEHEGRTHELADEAGRRRALRALLPAFRVSPAAQKALLEGLAGRLGVADPAPCELATWEECGALQAAGMELGAHTLTHPFLSTLPATEQAAEIAGSFDLIARRLGVRPRGLAYPGGDHDAASVAAARAAGAAWAVTTWAGENRADAPAFELLRRGLSEGACLGPGGRFSGRMTLAALDGRFERLRARRAWWVSTGTAGGEAAG